MTSEKEITARQFQDADETGDWRVLGSGASLWFDAPSHTAGATLVQRIAEVCDRSDGGWPDLDLRHRGVRVRLRPEGGFFRPADVAAARSISALAEELGLPADPIAVQEVHLTLDTLDRESVMGFWRTVLGHEPLGEEDLADPSRRHPSIWFQDQDAPRPLRNRLHLDVVSTHAAAVAAVAYARGAGCTVAEHGYYATIADPEGNEADVLPLQDGADRWGGAATEDWRVVFAAVACYPARSLGAAADVAHAVARLADEAALPLGIDLRPGLVTIDTGKDAWEEHAGYASLAAQVQRAARTAGLRADVERPRFVQVGIDAVDVEAVREFWRTVLGYEKDPRSHVTDLVDPRQLNLPVFFQQMEASDTERRAQRNRIHVDLFVPADQVHARVAAGLAAGGKIIRDAEAPACWTLADPEGNEVDVAASLDRDQILG